MLNVSTTLGESVEGSDFNSRPCELGPNVKVGVVVIVSDLPPDQSTS